MKILLVGGAGFIGHHLALRLKEEGYDPYVVDSCQVNNLIQHSNNKLYRRFIYQRFDMLSNAGIHIKYTDARDYHELSRVVDYFQPEVLIHLAAVAHANISNKNPHLTFDHSLRTLENALDASTNTSVNQFIYFSSSMVYGDFKDEFVTERSSLRPKGIYGALKVSGEMIVKAYNEVFGLNYTIIRPSALYGERCVSGRVIQKFIENYYNGLPLTIHGDGKEKLDFTYIRDLVEGVCLTINNESAFNKVFNMTYGDSRSIIDAANIVNNHHAIRQEIVYTKRNGLMPKRGTLSILSAKNLLGYKPWYGIERGIPEYMRWYRDYF